MTKLPYLRSMFAACMFFQVVYVLCVILWVAFPALKGHELLPMIFPNFTLLTIGSFIYGLVAAMIYGWIAAVIFVFFYNLWPSVVSIFLGRRGKNIRNAAAAGMLFAVALTGMPSSISTANAQGVATSTASLAQPTIKALQDALNKQGIAVKADGVFTQETRDAVRKFQSQHHLPVTGEADNATLAKLGVSSSAATEQAPAGQTAQSSAVSGQSSPGMGMRMGMGMGMGQGGMMGGSMNNGPMMQGMMQGMMKTMQGMMGMMQAQWEQNSPAQTEPSERRQTQGQGGPTMNCPMMSAESGPAMTQMMQGMMQMMQMMQGQLQSAPKQ